MIINNQEYITWEQLELLKKIYQTPSLKPNYNCVYPKEHQLDALYEQKKSMTIYSFLADKTGYFNIAAKYDPRLHSMEYYEKLMNPEPSFLNEYGEPLYKNPFGYQHKLPEGEFRIY